MTMDYTLYGSDHSLFTGKVRAYLRYKGLAFEERLATRDIYKNVILPNIGAPIIPVLETAAGEFVQDTTDIIDFLEARHPEAPVYPQAPVQRLVALLLEMFGDEWLIIPAMHYRWSVIDQQYEFVMAEFGRLSNPEASHAEQVSLGERLSKPFSGMLPALGITPDTIPGIEAAYLQLLDQLELHFAQHAFLLGSRPCIGDYGFMGPLYAHLGRDPVPLAIMKKRAPHVHAWVERMNDPLPCSGEFLAQDEIPETLIPILQTLCLDQLPDVLDVVESNRRWLQDNPGGSIPRFLGMHPFTFGAARGERVVSSYVQWLFQRPWRHYQNLGDSERASVDTLLMRIGGLPALQCALPHWLVRCPGQLELVEGAPH